MYRSIDIANKLWGSGGAALPKTTARWTNKATPYGQFSKYHVCFCGLDPGNLKFETVRTNKQHICF